MTADDVANRLIDLYFGNAEMALPELFCMAKAYNGKSGDMPNAFWAKVARIIVSRIKS